MQNGLTDEFKTEHDVMLARWLEYALFAWNIFFFKTFFFFFTRFEIQNCRHNPLKNCVDK